MAAAAKKSTVKSFVDQFISLIEGDDAKVLAEKAYRQSQSALKSHISSYEGDTIDFEDKLQDAKEALEKATVNNGKPITDRGQYITDLFYAKNRVTEAEENLEAHIEKIEFLKEQFGA